MLPSHSLAHLGWTANHTLLPCLTPADHPCCRGMAALRADPLTVAVDPTAYRFAFRRDNVSVGAPAYVSGTGRGRYDATNLDGRVLLALCPDLDADPTRPWWVFYDAWRGPTWATWTSANGSADGSACVAGSRRVDGEARTKTDGWDKD